MKVLKVACDFLIEIPEAASPVINESVVNKIKQIVNNPPKTFFRIDQNIIEKSDSLLEWFGTHKLFLAKYPMDGKLTYKNNLQNI
jgi:hypothetical protein